jgi:hypothetical protein
VNAFLAFANGLGDLIHRFFQRKPDCEAATALERSCSFLGPSIRAQCDYGGDSILGREVYSSSKSKGVEVRRDLVKLTLIKPSVFASGSELRF